MRGPGSGAGRVTEDPGQHAAQAAGFGLLEVMVATVIVGVLLAAVLGAVTGLSRLGRSVSERARVETAASGVLSGILQGSPDRPGVVAATKLLPVDDGRLKFEAKVNEKDVVYEYVHDRTKRQLTLKAGTADPVVVLEGVEAFTASRLVRHDRVSVRVELTLRVPTPNGATTWRVAAEGVPRNGSI